MPPLSQAQPAPDQPLSQTGAQADRPLPEEPSADDLTAAEPSAEALATGATAPANPAWRCAAASVIGVSHVRAQQPLQDAYACEFLADGTVVVAVADGAGSAARAEEGSALAVQTALTATLAELSIHVASAAPAHNVADWRVLLQQIFGQVRAELETKAAQQEAPLRDYATTLLVLIATAEQTVCGLIGDCAAVIQQRDGTLVSLCVAQKGQYANMTHFLTQEDALAQLDVQMVHGPAERAAIFSDGLLELALNLAQNRPHAPFFMPLFKFVATAPNDQQASADLAGFLGSARINSRTHDDKTLVLLSRVGEVEELDVGE